jgi:hypothetical protein
MVIVGFSNVHVLSPVHLSGFLALKGSAQPSRGVFQILDGIVSKTSSSRHLLTVQTQTQTNSNV